MYQNCIDLAWAEEYLTGTKRFNNFQCSVSSVYIKILLTGTRSDRTTSKEIMPPIKHKNRMQLKNSRVAIVNLESAEKEMSCNSYGNSLKYLVTSLTVSLPNLLVVMLKSLNGFKESVGISWWTVSKHCYQIHGLSKSLFWS